MKRADNKDGSYILTANEGKDLAIQDADGNIISRTKEVIIPAAGTLNTWIEVDELPPEPMSEDATKAERIAELEAELARLKGE